MAPLVKLRLRPPPRPAVAEGVGPLRLRRVPALPGRVLLTNDAGAYLVIDEAELAAVLEGRVDPLSPRYQELLDRHFLLPDAPDAVEAVRTRSRHVFYGPSLHIMALTLRCNQACHYCHSSKVGPSATGVDMSLDIAHAIVDRIFEAPSPQLHIEFQGGEPLMAWQTLTETVRYARLKNRDARRELAFTVVTNLTLMDDDKLDWLVDHGVHICTSLDGPADLHDGNRPWVRGSAHAQICRWIEKIHARWARAGLSEHTRVNALTTVTRASLTRGRDIADEFARLGLYGLALRTLDPFGFARPLWHKLGYTADEFMGFWRDTLDHVIQRNLAGVELVEKHAAMFLTKMLTPRDPNHMDWRSPCGATIGQIAYNYDGNVYTCDEGRMVAEMGDELFKVGTVDDSYEAWIQSPTTRAVAAASTLDGQPYCESCAYKPWCGVCPVYNYIAQGDLWGQMPANDRCKTSMGMQDYLVERLAGDADGRVRKVFERWTLDRA